MRVRETMKEENGKELVTKGTGNKEGRKEGRDRGLQTAVGTERREGVNGVSRNNGGGERGTANGTARPLPPPPSSSSTPIQSQPRSDSASLHLPSILID